MDDHRNEVLNKLTKSFPNQNMKKTVTNDSRNLYDQIKKHGCRNFSIVIQKLQISPEKIKEIGQSNMSSGHRSAVTKSLPLNDDSLMETVAAPSTGDPLTEYSVLNLNQINSNPKFPAKKQGSTRSKSKREITMENNTDIDFRSSDNHNSFAIEHNKIKRKNAFEKCSSIKSCKEFDSINASVDGIDPKAELEANTNHMVGRKKNTALKRQRYINKAIVDRSELSSENSKEKTDNEAIVGNAFTSATKSSAKRKLNLDIEPKVKSKKTKAICSETINCEENNMTRYGKKRTYSVMCAEEKNGLNLENTSVSTSAQSYSLSPEHVKGENINLLKLSASINLIPAASNTKNKCTVKSNINKKGRKRKVNKSQNIHTNELVKLPIITIDKAGKKHSADESNIENEKDENATFISSSQGRGKEVLTRLTRKYTKPLTNPKPGKKSSSSPSPIQPFESKIIPSKEQKVQNTFKKKCREHSVVPYKTEIRENSALNKSDEGQSSSNISVDSQSNNGNVFISDLTEAHPVEIPKKNSAVITSDNCWQSDLPSHKGQVIGVNNNDNKQSPSYNKSDSQRNLLKGSPIKACYVTLEPLLQHIKFTDDTSKCSGGSEAATTTAIKLHDETNCPSNSKLVSSEKNNSPIKESSNYIPLNIESKEIIKDAFEQKQLTKDSTLISTNPLKPAIESPMKLRDKTNLTSHSNLVSPQNNNHQVQESPNQIPSYIESKEIKEASEPNQMTKEHTLISTNQIKSVELAIDTPMKLRDTSNSICHSKLVLPENNNQQIQDTSNQNRTKIESKEIKDISEQKLMIKNSTFISTNQVKSMESAKKNPMKLRDKTNSTFHTDLVSPQNNNQQIQKSPNRMPSIIESLDEKEAKQVAKDSTSILTNKMKSIISTPMKLRYKNNSSSHSDLVSPENNNPLIKKYPQHIYLKIESKTINKVSEQKQIAKYPTLRSTNQVESAVEAPIKMHDKNSSTSHSMLVLPGINNQQTQELSNQVPSNIKSKEIERIIVQRQIDKDNTLKSTDQCKSIGAAPIKLQNEIYSTSNFELASPENNSSLINQSPNHFPLKIVSNAIKEVSEQRQMINKGNTFHVDGDRKKYNNVITSSGSSNKSSMSHTFNLPLIILSVIKSNKFASMSAIKSKMANYLLNQLISDHEGNNSESNQPGFNQLRRIKSEPSIFTNPTEIKARKIFMNEAPAKLTIMSNTARAIPQRHLLKFLISNRECISHSYLIENKNCLNNEQVVTIQTSKNIPFESTPNKIFTSLEGINNTTKKEKMIISSQSNGKLETSHTSNDDFIFKVPTRPAPRAKKLYSNTTSNTFIKPIHQISINTQGLSSDQKINTKCIKKLLSKKIVSIMQKRPEKLDKDLLYKLHVDRSGFMSYIQKKIHITDINTSDEMSEVVISTSETEEMDGRLVQGTKSNQNSGNCRLTASFQLLPISLVRNVEKNTIKITNSKSYSKESEQKYNAQPSTQNINITKINDNNSKSFSKESEQKANAQNSTQKINITKINDNNSKSFSKKSEQKSNAHGSQQKINITKTNDNNTKSFSKESEQKANAQDSTQKINITKINDSNSKLFSKESEQKSNAHGSQQKINITKINYSNSKSFSKESEQKSNAQDSTQNINNTKTNDNNTKPFLKESEQKSNGQGSTQKINITKLNDSNSKSFSKESEQKSNAHGSQQKTNVTKIYDSNSKSFLNESEQKSNAQGSTHKINITKMNDSNSKSFSKESEQKSNAQGSKQKINIKISYSQPSPQKINITKMNDNKSPLEVPYLNRFSGIANNIPQYMLEHNYYMKKPPIKIITPHILHQKGNQNLYLYPNQFKKDFNLGNAMTQNFQIMSKNVMTSNLNNRHKLESLSGTNHNLNFPNTITRRVPVESKGIHVDSSKSIPLGNQQSNNSKSIKEVFSEVAALRIRNSPNRVIATDSKTMRANIDLNKSAISLQNRTLKLQNTDGKSMLRNASPLKNISSVPQVNLRLADKLKAILKRKVQKFFSQKYSSARASNQTLKLQNTNVIFQGGVPSKLRNASALKNISSVPTNFRTTKFRVTVKGPDKKCDSSQKYSFVPSSTLKLQTTNDESQVGVPARLSNASALTNISSVPTNRRTNKLNVTASGPEEKCNSPRKCPSVLATNSTLKSQTTDNNSQIGVPSKLSTASALKNISSISPNVKMTNLNVTVNEPDEKCNGSQNYSSVPVSNLTLKLQTTDNNSQVGVPSKLSNASAFKNISSVPPNLRTTTLKVTENGTDEKCDSSQKHSSVPASNSTLKLQTADDKSQVELPSKLRNASALKNVSSVPANPCSTKLNVKLSGHSKNSSEKESKIADLGCSAKEGRMPADSSSKSKITEKKCTKEDKSPAEFSSTRNNKTDEDSTSCTNNLSEKMVKFMAECRKVDNTTAEALNKYKKSIHNEQGNEELKTIITKETARMNRKARSNRPPEWFLKFIGHFRKQELWRLHQMFKIHDHLMRVESAKLNIVEQIYEEMKLNES